MESCVAHVKVIVFNQMWTKMRIFFYSCYFRLGGGHSWLFFLRRSLLSHSVYWFDVFMCVVVALVLKLKKFLFFRYTWNAVAVIVAKQNVRCPHSVTFIAPDYISIELHVLPFISLLLLLFVQCCLCNASHNMHCLLEQINTFLALYRLTFDTLTFLPIPFSAARFVIIALHCVVHLVCVHRNWSDHTERMRSQTICRINTLISQFI